MDENKAPISAPVLPRLFISAVSDEFQTIRQEVAKVARILGYQPVSMDDWCAGHGELRAWLRRQIDSCDGLIHLPGVAYGTEPEDQSPAAHSLPVDTPRYSYTHYEFLYAEARKIKIWVITPGPGCTRDHQLDTLDSPNALARSEPDYQATRRRLQHAWLERLKKQNYIRYSPQDDRDLRLLLHTLTDHAAELRQKFAEWQTFVGGILGLLEGKMDTVHDATLDIKRNSTRLYRLSFAVLLAALVLGVAGWFAFHHLGTITTENTHAIQRALADPIVLRAKLEKQIREKAEKQIAPLRAKNGSFREIDEIERQRDIAISRLNDLIESVGRNLAEDADPVYIEAAQILEKEGLDAAIEFLKLKRPKLLEKARQIKAEQDDLEKQKRQTLKPVELESALLETNLDWKGALALREEITSLAPKWWNARNNLGTLCLSMVKLPEAEREFRAAEDLAESASDKGTSLNNLAIVMQDSNRLEEAEKILMQTLAIFEKSGKSHEAELSSTHNNIGQLCQLTGRLQEAESHFRRSLAIDESTFAEDDPTIGRDLNNLGSLLLAKNDIVEAEGLFRRAIEIIEKAHPKNLPNLATDTLNLASLFHATNRPLEAEPLFRRALKIDEECYGPDHPVVARDLNNLSVFLLGNNRIPEAESAARRAVNIYEKAFGKDHPNVATSLNNLGAMLFKSGERAEAESLFRRALEIHQAAYGPNHPEVAKDLNNLGFVFENAKRSEDAEASFRGAVAALEKSLGPDHPDLATALHNLAELLRSEGRLSDAYDCNRRALAIHLKAFGRVHPDVANDLNTLALIRDQNPKEAEPISRDAVVIFLKVMLQTAQEHSEFRKCFSNYLGLLLAQKLTKDEIHLRLQSLGVAAGWEEGNWRKYLADLVRQDQLPPLNTFRDPVQIEDYLKQAEVALNQIRDKYGAHSEQACGFANDLAIQYMQHENIKRAEELLRSILEDRTKLFGLSDARTLSSLNNLGTILAERGDDTDAVVCYEDCFKRRESVLGIAHGDTLKTAYNLALSLNRLGKKERAIQLLDSAHELARKAFGPTDEVTKLMDKGLSLVKR